MGVKFQAGEWKNVAIFTMAVTLLTTLPYVAGWASAGEDWVYNGFTFGVEDGNAYLGKMKIGVRGGWEFSLFYTPEDHESAFGLYLPYIMVGHIIRLLYMPSQPETLGVLAIAFQVVRIISDMVLIPMIYYFIAFFVRARSTRWLALLLALFGGGLGWLLVLSGQEELFGTLPVDFYIPEGFSFLVISGLPHIALGRAAMLAGFLALFLALRFGKLRYALLAGLLWNIVGLMVTFYLAVLYALMGAWGLTLWLRRRRFPVALTVYGGTAVALTLPGLTYNAWLFSSHETFSQWSKQNFLPSPHPLHYLFGYGILALLALRGIAWAWENAAKPQQESYALLVGWVLVAPILVYLPLNVQRRLAEGVLVPLAILAAVGLKLSLDTLWTRKISLTRRYRRTRLITMMLVFPSALLLWMTGLFGMLAPADPAFRPAAEVRAMDWLAGYAEPGTVVFAAWRTGNYLPIRTDLRPFLGHGPETIYSTQKRETVERFFNNEMSKAERDQLFEEFRIRFVIYGISERELGDGSLSWAEDLTEIYNQNGYWIYEVSQE